jgi:hypothetical protein
VDGEVGGLPASGVDPCLEIVAPIENLPSDLEALRTGAEVPPVAKRCCGRPKPLSAPEKDPGLPSGV